MDPTDLRRQLRALRNSVPEEDRLAASESVALKLRDLLATVTPGPVGTYFAADGELDPAPGKLLLEPLGWEFFLPVVGTDVSMNFRMWDAESRLVPNHFGIPEPDDNSTEIAPADLDVVLMPCVALDLFGNRLGMGAGYYDRAFEDPKIGPLRIAVAYEFQLLPELSANEWDVPADIVVTESRVIRTQADPT